MRNNRETLTAVFLVLCAAGCATRDNTEFQLFHTQTRILADGTAAAFESALLFSRQNLVEAIADGNIDLLENMILQREGVFTLSGDPATIPAGLSLAQRAVREAGSTIAEYTMLLAAITDSTNIAFSIGNAGQPYTGVFASVTAVLVEHGRIEHDSRRVLAAMQTASPQIDSLSSAMAELNVASANAVQAAYADMAARRQRAIAYSGGSPEAVRELIALNTEASSLLDELSALRDVWLLVPAVHSELMSSLVSVSSSSTLRVLTMRLIDINRKVKAGNE